jgi:rubrerythrin
MGLWSRLFRWGHRAGADEPEDAGIAAPPAPDGTVTLPVDPFVFECQSCGKVFEARRRRPLCPECDSPDVALMSE